MEYKRLGSTELNISRVGFGCWAIGGHGYGDVDDSDSIKAIEKALDLGVNFFDTADIYGFGRSEKVLAKALGKRISSVTVSTKFGVGWDGNGKTFKDCSPKRVVAALEGSLRRLQLECIPLYQIHWHDGATPISETIEALNKCRKEGKIRYVGCSNFTYALLEEAHKTGRIESLEVLYNIIRRSSEGDVLRCTRDFKMGVIAYEILGRGLLSGKYTKMSEFGCNDTRKKDKGEPEKFDAYIALAQVLEEIGARYGRTASQVAIRWVLDNPDVTCALVGVKRARQIEEDVDVFNWSLSPNDKRRIEMSAANVAGARAEPMQPA